MDNVLLVYDLRGEHSSHTTSSSNDFLKYFPKTLSNETMLCASFEYFAWLIYIGEFFLFNTSNDMIGFSLTY